MSSLRPVRGTSAEIVVALRSWLDEAREPEPLAVETSGSTGRPKRVMLSRRALLASAEVSARRVGARGGDGRGRWLLTLPAPYVAGVNVILRSLAAGHDPVLLEDHPSFAAATAALGDGPRYTSLVPTQLHRLLESPGASAGDAAEDRAALASYDAVLVGGGPMDPALRRRAEEAGVRLVATYGSSETCGGCVYDGLPLDGVALAIGTDGRIRIAGPVLFDGYERDPELTRESLVDGWFLTSDAGRLDEDGRLQVLGRLDDVVVSGGVNVPTPAVAARLREHAGVRAVEVVGVPDEEWGHRVVAWVVGSISLDEARDFVAAAHPRSWAPREVRVVDALPLLDNGKVDRLRLKEEAR